jgi:hypothetical protein
MFVAAFYLMPVLAATNEGAHEELPNLRPPRGEIPPGFLEQHTGWVIAGSLLLLAMVCLAVWLLSRPKPPVLVPPAESARRVLEPLRAEPETGVLLSRVSQAVRSYFRAAFGLPRGESTTTEFCRALADAGSIGPGLAAEVTAFLRESDERKFSPASPGTPFGAVDRALALVQAGERARSRMAETSPAHGEEQRKS